jgi:hypothetical protein
MLEKGFSGRGPQSPRETRYSALRSLNGTGCKSIGRALGGNGFPAQGLAAITKRLGDVDTVLNRPQALGINVLEGKLGSISRAACSAPMAGSLVLSSRPTCASRQA